MKMNGTRKILIYILLVLAVVLIWCKKYSVIDINPIIIRYNYADDCLYRMESYELQLVFYSSAFYMIMALLCVLKNAYIKESDIFYVILIIGCVLGSIFSFEGLILLIIVWLIRQRIKASYPEYSFVENLKKSRKFIFAFIILLLITINIIYIVIPKKKMFVFFENEIRGSIFIYDLIEDGIEESLFLEIGSWRSNFDGQGSVIEAKTQGEKVVVYARLQDEPPEFIKLTGIEVDENLKFHFDIDLEYIMLFYPLNFYIIVWCVIFSFLSCVKYIKEKTAKKKLMREVGD